MSEETLESLIKKQITIEKNFVATVQEQIDAVHNVAARLLLLETQKDSEKHALILEGILQVISQTGARPLRDTLIDGYIDKIVVKKNLEKHIEIENTMMKHVEEEIRKTQDEGIKLLLQHIASDEKKHHEILQTVIKNAYKISP